MMARLNHDVLRNILSDLSHTTSIFSTFVWYRSYLDHKIPTYKAKIQNISGFRQKLSKPLMDPKIGIILPLTDLRIVREFLGNEKNLIFYFKKP